MKPRESSQEQPDWGHGAFTKALLETFGDPSKDLPPADGLLSIDELMFPLGAASRTLPAMNSTRSSTAHRRSKTSTSSRSPIR